MVKILFITIILSIASLNASDTNSEREKRLAKQLKIDMEKEKKYSVEQAFYGVDRYNFKGAEVNKDSLDSVPELEVDDLDMDSVYD